MAIKSSPFSGPRLSGKDAENFLKLVNDPTPNPLAQAALAQAKKLVEENTVDGIFYLTTKK